MSEKTEKLFYEDDPATLEYSYSPVTEAERKRAENEWKELTEQ